MRRRTAVPFYVRPDTTDAAVINDIFVKGGYDLRRRDRTTKQRRHADVAAFLEREQQRTGKRPLIPMPVPTSASTINDMFRQNAATHFPFIVKIDIEGGEAALCSDSTEWVGQILIVELHDWLLPRRGISQPFLKSIAPLDRDLIHIGEDIYSISNVL